MDYILFIHGVNTRERRESPDYAQPLCNLIESCSRQSEQKIALKMVPLYWGDVNAALEDSLLRTYKRSECWDELSFKEIREKQLLQFTGDAALYISRYAGARVVDKLSRQATDPQTGLGTGPYSAQKDRLHLVTHSFGTVILFDILFSGRWNPSQTGSYQTVAQIRKLIFGLEPSREKGLRLCSIHTMGSPISVYSLIMSDGKLQRSPTFADGADGNQDQAPPNTHDITPDLLKWLSWLPYPVPWYNYLHPEDPIAYPLEELIPQMLENPKFAVSDKLMVKDIITADPTKFLNTIADLGARGNGDDSILQKMSNLTQASQVVLHGGKAHNSYWSNPLVATRIFQTIQETEQQSQQTRPSLTRNFAQQGLKMLLRK